jgi:hypothetical protein
MRHRAPNWEGAREAAAGPAAFRRLKLLPWVSARDRFSMGTALMRFGALISLLAGAVLPFQVQAVEKISIRINNQLISAYRTGDLDAAKQEAATAHRPIAWIASAPKLLDGHGNISQTTSRGATLHAFFALRDRAVLVFMDAYEENHKVPEFIDYALHNPDPHYTPPTVLLLDSEAKKVLATVIYEPDFVKRAKALAKALDDIKGKF